LVDKTLTTVDALVEWELSVDVEDFVDDEDEGCVVELNTLVVFNILVRLVLLDDLYDVNVLFDPE
jgi:hypothetical protein